MSTPVAPPSPVTPLGYQAAKGEMRLTDGGVVMWDGRSWQPADLFAAILDDPTNFNSLIANSVQTPVVRFGTGDPAEVIPAQITGEVNGSGPTRSPELQLNPPIFIESDQSILAASLALVGTSVDGSQAPRAFLWTKQAGIVYLSAVTDATFTMDSYLSVADGELTLVASGHGPPSTVLALSGLTGFAFSGAEDHSGGAETHAGAETHNGTEQHNGITHFGRDVYFDYFTTFNQQETHQASEYHNGYENHTGLVQNNGTIRAGSGLSTGTGTVTAGSYTFVTITFGPTMNNVGVNLTLVGSLDTSTFVHYWSFTARTSTTFKVYATNWSDSTTYIGYQACALG